MRKPFTVLVTAITAMGFLAILAEGLMAGLMNWDVDHAQSVLVNTFVILTIPALLLVYFVLSSINPHETQTGRFWKAMSIPALVFLVGLAHTSVVLNIWITTALTGILVWFTVRVFHAGHAAIPYASETRGFWTLFLPFFTLDLITFEVQTYGTGQFWLTVVGLILFGGACALSYRLVGYMRDHHHGEEIPPAVCTRPDQGVDIRA
jgi:hypothetical protein